MSFAKCVVTSLFLLILAVAPAWGAVGIASVSGQLDIIDQPVDARRNVLESDRISVWLEGAATSSSGVLVDVDTAGTYHTPGSIPSPTTVANGIDFRSYMLHFDAPGAPSSPGLQRSGTVTFTNKILGVIVNNTTMQASDFLTTTLHLNGRSRGLEVGDDRFSFAGSTFSADRLRAYNSVDEVRIITAVPEPGTLGVWAVLGLSAFGIRRLRRAKPV